MPGAGSLAATFVAGLASFLSPCTVPLLPAFVATVGGVAAADAADPALRSRLRGRAVTGALLYVAGFATVFVLLGISAAGIGPALHRADRPLEIVGGILLVVLGLLVSGVLRWTPLVRERRAAIPERLRRVGPAAAFPLGVVFGVGWTPCVGPYLGAALVVAASSGRAVEGGLLLLAYAIGLGLPLVLVALAGAALPDAGRRLARFAHPVAVGGGVVMTVLGVILVTGGYGRLTSALAAVSTGH